MSELDNVSGIVIFLNKDLRGTGIELLFGSSLCDIVSGFGLPVSRTKFPGDATDVTSFFVNPFIT
jgi:hypothetical protein